MIYSLILNEDSQVCSCPVLRCSQHVLNSPFSLQLHMLDLETGGPAPGPISPEKTSHPLKILPSPSEHCSAKTKYQQGVYHGCQSSCSQGRQTTDKTETKITCFLSLLLLLNLYLYQTLCGVVASLRLSSPVSPSLIALMSATCRPT